MRIRIVPMVLMGGVGVMAAACALDPHRNPSMFLPRIHFFWSKDELGLGVACLAS